VRLTTVALADGVLSVVGDGESDAVSLTSLDDDSVEVAATTYDGVTAVVVDLGGGDDTLTIVNDGALFAPAEGISYDGNSGFDTLVFEGTGSGLSASYSHGPANDEGVVSYTDGVATQVLSYDGIEPVIDLVPGALLVLGTNDANQITYTVGTAATNGLVSVDGFETIEFSNKTSLTLSALNGDDVIALDNPNTPTSLTQIIVSGGEPTASDQAILNGTSAFDNVTFEAVDADSANVTGAGPVPIALDQVEEAHYNGQGGGDSLGLETLAGQDQCVLTPGTDPDEGEIDCTGFDAGLLSPSYEALGSLGLLAFKDDGAVRSDILHINDRNTANEDDFFVVSPSGTDQVQILEAATGTSVTVLIGAPGVASLQLNGLDGNDVFSINADHPYTGGINVEGGSPDDGDQLVVSRGPGDGITALPAISRVVETSAGNPIDYSGVAEVVLDTAPGEEARIEGDTSDEEFEVWAASTGVRTIGRLGSPRFVLPAGDSVVVETEGGNDRLVVNGTPGNDAIVVDDDDVSVNAVSVGYANAQLEQLLVLGDSGGDAISATVATRALEIRGGPGGDTITGGAGTDTVFGDEGPDILNGGTLSTRAPATIRATAAPGPTSSTARTGSTPSHGTPATATTSSTAATVRTCTCSTATPGPNSSSSIATTRAGPARTCTSSGCKRRSTLTWPASNRSISTCWAAWTRSRLKTPSEPT
jgi:hypothetical protein